MATEGELRNNMDGDSDGIQELQEQVAVLKAEVHTYSNPTPL